MDVMPTVRANRGTVLVILASAAILVLLIAEQDAAIGVSLLALILPASAWLVIARDERTGRTVDPRVVAVAAGVLLVAAVVVVPGGSQDVWSYAMYGRMVSHYGVSPFNHVPADFPHDPFLHLVAGGWRHTPSVYGPLFVVIAAVGSQLAGSSALALRLFHQSLAAGAVAFALVLVWRETRSVAAIAFLGLNPLVVVNVVNNGHNDALVGLAALGAVLLASRRHFVWAGVVIGAAALIKITAALAIPALVVWALWRFGWKPARDATLGACAVIGGMYLAAGTAAISALGTNHRLMSRASMWQIPRQLFGEMTAHPAFGIRRLEWINLFSTGSIVLVAALALGAAWRGRRDLEPARADGLALAAYIVAGVYVLPWYVIWVIPVACLTTERRFRTLMITLCTLLPAAYAVKARSFPQPVESEWWFLSASVIPVILLVVFLVALLPARTSRPRSESNDPAPLPVPPQELAAPTTTS